MALVSLSKQIGVESGFEQGTRTSCVDTARFNRIAICKCAPGEHYAFGVCPSALGELGFLPRAFGEPSWTTAGQGAGRSLRGATGPRPNRTQSMLSVRSGQGHCPSTHRRVSGSVAAYQALVGNRET